MENPFKSLRACGVACALYPAFCAEVGLDLIDSGKYSTIDSAPGHILRSNSLLYDIHHQQDYYRREIITQQ